MNENARSTLGWSLAFVFAWSCVLLVNASWIASHASDAAFPTRAAHHFYDAGQMLFLGICHALLAAMVERANARSKWRSWAWYGVMLVLGWGAASLTFSDVRGFIVNQLHTSKAAYWYATLTLVGSFGLCVSLFVGSLLNRPYFRWLTVAVGAVATWGNESMLVYEYAGPHLFVAVGCALAVGAAFRGCRLPFRPAVAIERLVFGILCVVALASVTTVPSPSVGVRIYRTPGAVLAPFLARFHRDQFVKNPPTGSKLTPEWLVPRNPDPLDPGPAVLPRSDLIVILLTVDALRPALIEDPRYAASLPTFVSLRQRAISFTQARAVSPLTRLTIPSMATGLYPVQFERRKNPAKAAKKHNNEPCLAMRETPIRTVHVYSNPNITKQAPGFKEVIEAKEGIGYAIAELVKVHQIGPLLIYGHFMESHAPYGAEEDRHLPAYERYVKDVMVVDQQLAAIRDTIRQSNKEARTVLIVSADHGEAFGEHGFYYHAKTLYEEMVRVPLMIESEEIGAREITVPVSTIDLTPTVLDLFGQQIPGTLMGQSLTGFLRGATPKLSRPIAMQNALGLFAIVFPDGHKMIYDRKRRVGELYDLLTDPLEKNNLLENPDSSEYLGALATFFKVQAQ